jgi:predicted RNA-binding Zn ribbon-like protein
MDTGDARWVWYGERPSLDFVNTRLDREGHGVEHLDAPRDLADWLRAAKLIRGTTHVDDALLADAIELREAIDVALRASVAGDVVPSAALRVVNQWLATHVAQPPRLRVSNDLTVLDTDATQAPDIRQALARIALDAAQLLGTEKRARLRVCPGAECGGRFLDDSPAGRRRWCSMAVCGNRHKAASHRNRQRETPSAG